MNRKGFTLLELVVCISLIAILLGLLLPGIQFLREAARRTQCESRIKELVLAHHMYHETNSTFPQLWVMAFAGDETKILNEPPERLRCASQTTTADDGGTGLTPFAQNGLLVGARMSEITDGLSQTILQGERSQAEDWKGSPLLPSINCESHHHGGAVFGLADGSVRFLSATTSEELRVYLLLPNDGSVISLP